MAACRVYAPSHDPTNCKAKNRHVIIQEAQLSRVSLTISLQGHSRSFEMTLLSRARVSYY